jgi:uncharacterized protein YkwD
LPAMRLIHLTICLFLSLAAPAFALDEPMARQVLDEINLARSAPHIYGGFLREFRGRFRGRSYQLPESTKWVKTKEGRGAVDEAIRFLSRQKPLPPLSWSDGLAAAAADLAVEQGKSGAISDVSRQSRSLRERVERHGRWEREIGENICYGAISAREMVMNLIIDDGVKRRGHRKNTFAKAYTTAGVACGSHPRFDTMCVIDFASGFRE